MFKFNSSVAALAVAAGLAVASGVALADGGPSRSIKDAPIAPFSWTGMYIGANVGGAWGDSSTSSSFTCPDPGFCPYNQPANLAVLTNSGSGALSPNGMVGGVQAGYNSQTGNFLWGVEVDFSALDVKQSRSVTGVLPAAIPPNFNTVTSMSTDWLFTARARLGMVLSSNLLVYATGGLAVTDLTVSNSFSSPFPAAGSSSRSELKTGWTVGAGAEYAMNRNWTLRAEYLYVDFDSVTTTGLVNFAPLQVGVVANVFSTSADLSMHIGRLGINYKF